MRCVVCKQGEIAPGEATVVLTRPDATLVVRKVPALVCENCGEEYVDEAVTSRLLETAENIAKSGVEVEVRQYVA